MRNGAAHRLRPDEAWLEIAERERDSVMMRLKRSNLHGWCQKACTSACRETIPGAESGGLVFSGADASLCIGKLQLQLLIVNVGWHRLGVKSFYRSGGAMLFRENLHAELAAVARDRWALVLDLSKLVNASLYGGHGRVKMFGGARCPRERRRRRIGRRQRA